MARSGAPARPAVLLVDDDQTMLRLLAATLRGPFRLLQATTATDALRLARDERPVMMLLDIRLGAEDGLRLCRRLKAEPETSSIRIVIVSGVDDPVTRLRARRAGAEGFFAKPFSPLAIWKVLDDAVAS